MNRASVVINTLNRADALEQALRSLRRLNHPDFEVIVVNGPSSDHTLQVLQKWASSIRVGSCSDRNLSISRNVGIEMARGDLVAFIDDDDVVTENWLNDAVAGFDSEEVGGVGGLVFDHTGHELQYAFTVCDRYGNAYFGREEPALGFCYPGCLRYPVLQGGNCVFRRTALLEIGGFDEEFDYYLDEGDVCLRLTDAGYVLKHVPKAFVYHRSLPSYLRNGERIVTDWRPFVKNKAYFSLKNTLPGSDLPSAFRQPVEYASQAEIYSKARLAATGAGEQVIDEVSMGLGEALREGIARGLTQPRRFLSSAAAAKMRGPVAMDPWENGHAGTFKPCPAVLQASEKLTVCLLSSGYLPEKKGGIARLTYDLACGLAARGHIVHVLTTSPHSHNTVDFEEDVWVHRLVPSRRVPPPPPDVEVPLQTWWHSATMLQELYRIRAMHPSLDLVEAPVWDAEGIAAMTNGSFRVVTSLHTPLKSWIKTNPDLINGSAEQRNFFEGQIAAEKLVVERSHGVRANSEAIVINMREAYGIEFGANQLSVIPHGMEDRSKGLNPRRNSEYVTVLYTGRLELRKGIDMLLEVIPALCFKHPAVRFILVGEEIPRSYGITPTASFKESLAAAPFRDRVIFTGAVSDAELERLLAECDVFVAPSRYESFGLVFIEAMMFGKPAIGCRAGGMAEVIVDGVTGLLAEPGDSQSLAEALDRLISSAELRKSLGEAGRKRYLEHYTRDRLIDRTLEFYRQVIQSSTPGDAKPPTLAYLQAKDSNA